MSSKPKASECNRAVAEYKQKLQAALNKVKRMLDVEEGVQKQKVHLLGPAGLEPFALGLSEQLGKWVRQGDIALLIIPGVNNVMSSSTLKAKELKEVTEPILSKLSAEFTQKAQNYQDQLNRCQNRQRQRDLVIMLHFCELYRNLLRDSYLPKLEELYEQRKMQEEQTQEAEPLQKELPEGHEQSKKEEAEEKSHRTTCGAACKDGHPCQHTVWLGWICWQHGGGRWSQAA